MENTNNNTLHRFTCFVRSFTKKDGGKFTSIRIKGKYIPTAVNHKQPVNEEDYYTVRVVGGALPSTEGKYEILYTEGWVDERDPAKKLVRLRASGEWKFVSPLPEIKEKQ